LAAAVERGITMINNISEATIRVASKIDPGGAVHEKEFAAQKAKELREARPVEKGEAGNETDTDHQRKGKDSSRYSMENNQIVFEKYNKTGELIYRLPPSETPVDKMA
jgi:hypothetical protein